MAGLGDNEEEAAEYKIGKEDNSIVAVVVVAVVGEGVVVVISSN